MDKLNRSPFLAALLLTAGTSVGWTARTGDPRAGRVETPLFGNRPAARTSLAARRPGPPVVPFGTVTAIDDSVFNVRGIRGGGRKLIRHDCVGTLDGLDAVYARDLPVSVPGRLFNGLSLDDGATWSLAGRLDNPGIVSLRDRSMGISDIGSGTTFVGYSEEGSNAGLSTNWFIKSPSCAQSYTTPLEVTNELNALDEFFLQQEVTRSGIQDVIYWSWIDFATPNFAVYETYFQRSSNGGASWSVPLSINLAAAPVGWSLKGTDGPLCMAANGSFIAAMTYAVPEDADAVAMGLLPDNSYPVYTQSTNGGFTWSPMKLIFGENGAAYPHGHTGNPVVDPIIHYVGSVGAGFAAFNSLYSNIILDDEGLPHIACELYDTSTTLIGQPFGAGIFHTLVQGGGTTFTNTYVGYPEDIFLAEPFGEGLGWAPEISKTSRGDIVVSWVEFGAPDFLGDIIANVLPAGTSPSGSFGGPMDLTNTPLDDETDKRSVNIMAPATADDHPCTFEADYLYFLFGSGGNALDSTLYHLAAPLGPIPALPATDQDLSSATLPVNGTSTLDDTVTVVNANDCFSRRLRFTLDGQLQGRPLTRRTLVGPFPQSGGLRLGPESTVQGIFQIGPVNLPGLIGKTVELIFKVTDLDLGEDFETVTTFVLSAPGAGSGGTALASSMRDTGDDPLAGLTVSVIRELEEMIDGAELAADPALPRAFSLGANHPNPFNPSTTITFDLVAQNGEGKIPVTLSVYNLRGQLIITLVDHEMEPGTYTAHWNGRNSSGEEVPSGIYLYRLRAGDFRATRKMVLLK